MRKMLLTAGLTALGLAIAIPAFAQGPAKTPNGSMPAAPSSSIPQNGGSGFAPGGGEAKPMAMARPMKKRMRMSRRRMMRKKAM